MSRVRLKDRLKKGLLLLDGAMGTELIARRAEPGKCNEMLNLESPGIISQIHNSYLQAGADAVLTNTFGGNSFALARHGLMSRAAELNAAAARLARKAAGQSHYVLADIGPSGDFLEPVGSLKPHQLRGAFADQVKVLLAEGIDGFIIETMTAIEEIILAIEAIKSASSDLPVLASMAFDKRGPDFRTMMGVDVKTAVFSLVSAGADAVGFNCGDCTLDDYIDLAKRFLDAVRAKGKNVLVLAEPNAGRPELVEGIAVYKVTPDEFASAGQKIYEAGVTIIGGCCGSGPDHIQTLAQKLRA
ncbi:MAG: homocysteine S-methyltransferase family protein [Sedimentisphaerales bacterium]|nr:homocysteine S-methyltransferase family protein [Sedimentisphaerales bacterium]